MRQIGLLLLLLLAVLPSPASAQDIPPEATPEFWPLTAAPVVYPVDPDTLSLIFEAPGECVVSVDDQTVVIRGAGIYDLATGERRAGFDGHNGRLVINYRHPVVQVRGKGLYDLNTGELLVETQSRDAYMSSVDDYLIDGPVVYDVTTGDVVFEADGDVNYIQVQKLTPDSRWLSISVQPVGASRPSEFLRLVFDTETNALLDGDYAFMNRFFDQVSSLDRPGTAAALGGDGVYDLSTGEKRFDIPAMKELRFSDDGSILMGMSENEELQLIDARTGEILLRRDDAEWIGLFGRGGSRVGGYVLSPDNTRLIEPEYTEIRSNGQSTYTPLGATVTDVATGQPVARLPASQEYAFLLDGRFVHVVEKGVFDAATGEIVVQTVVPFIRVAFGGRYAWFSEADTLTIYDPQTWTMLRQFPGGLRTLGAEPSWVFARDGIYHFETGALVFAFEPLGIERPTTSISGRLILDVAEDRCAIYRLPD